MNIMDTYRANKARARFYNTQPSMTDQSQANDTDVNIIMKKYAVTGTAPGAPKAPMYIDMTNFPTTLRGVLEEGRKMGAYRRALPEQLRDKPIEELLMLTTEEIQTILTTNEKEEKSAPAGT